jgi:hypothetical protein
MNDRKPIFVRPITEEERKQLEAGLRSSEAFVMRRCQMLLASSRGEHAITIGRQLGCSGETVRGVIWAFEKSGLDVLKAKSRRPKEVHAAFSAEQSEKLKDLLHHSPREYGKETSLWTLELAAEVCHEQGITNQRFSDETVRATLERLGVRWRRAKEWITSPDSQYERKKTNETD